MARIHYIVTYYIEWNDGATTGGNLKFHTGNLEEIFNTLYEKVILEPIMDEELYQPGMINGVNISITKSQPGKCGPATCMAAE